MTQFFCDSLQAGGDRLALITEHESLSYSSLSQRIDDFAAGMRSEFPKGLSRPLVLVEAANDIDSVVAYLACLRAGWPVILVAEGGGSPTSSIVQTYQPNIVFRRDGAERRAWLTPAEPALMHAELAVLLSTSGTTGAAKLVRLSARNLQSNASAIAAYLELSSADRTLTALPFHYSYGMSVLHTYLLAHAGLVLSATSLVEPEFWSLARRHQVTSLALVPTQFEALERIASIKEQLPTLRYITQAGGKLHAKLAVEFARRAKAEGWQLFIMYGQTEASPRMSYLPPEDAERCYDSIGRPLEGGKFRIVDAAGKDIETTGEPGQLIFEGPNVMLGYALSRADLDKPAGPSVLATGDIAERLENGYFRLTGRTSRFIKLFGLRISLDEVEAWLRADGQRAYVSGSDEKLVVFLLDGRDPAALRTQITRRYHWPERVVNVVPLDAAPLLPSGKVDYAELSRRAASLGGDTASAPSSLKALFHSALRQAALDTDKSFSELGGDSLAYLEVQAFLSERVGNVPEGWERLPLRQLLALEAAGRTKAPGWQRVPFDLVARVVAILAVIALHCTNWKTGGGSILLLILVGYSLARFQSESLFAGRVLNTWRSMLGRILVVYFLFIGLGALKFAPFDLEWFLLVENFKQHTEPDFLGPYWFVSTYTQIVILASLPFALAPVRAKVRQAPFEAGVAASLLVGLLIQLTQVGAIGYQVRHHHPLVALELLLAGWCMFFATTSKKKLIASALIVLVWMQNYGLAEVGITALMLIGPLCTLWDVRVWLPRQVTRGLLLFGSLSLFIYLTHALVLYKVGALLDPGIPAFLVVVSVSVALAYTIKKASDLVVSRALGVRAVRSPATEGGA